jgi:hypothetical protein
LQQVVRFAGLAETWKDPFHSMPVIVRIPIGHGVDDECDVIAEIVGASRRRFDADTR